MIKKTLEKQKVPEEKRAENIKAGEVVRVNYEEQNYKSESDIKNWAEDELKNMCINDSRIIERASIVLETLANSPEESIPQASVSWSKTKATYRLLDNKKFTAEILMECHRNNSIKRISEENIILAIQDTTEVNYDTLEKTVGLGPHGSKEKSKGLIVHSTMALSTSGTPLGILDEKIWARDSKKWGESHNCRKYPIEEKESNKWLKGMDNSTIGIPNNIKVVHVCDREADIFEFLFKGIDEGKKFIVRARQDRKINDKDAEKLFEKIESLPVMGHIVTQIPRDTRKNLPPREVKLEVKYSEVSIIPPPYLPAKYKKNKMLEINIIVVKELDPPKGEDPIEWMLLTNLVINSLEDAIEKVKWYVHRWKIERFHYVLKSGCGVEKLQFESAEHLIKAIALYSIIAWRLLWIIYMSRENPNVSCEIVFEKQEWQVLDSMFYKKIAPREEPPKLGEVVLMVAMLGGFMARKHDGEPGVKVLWRGMNKLYTIIEYLDMVNNVSDMGNA